MVVGSHTYLNFQFNIMEQSVFQTYYQKNLESILKLKIPKSDIMYLKRLKIKFVYIRLKNSKNVKC